MHIIDIRTSACVPWGEWDYYWLKHIFSWVFEWNMASHTLVMIVSSYGVSPVVSCQYLNQCSIGILRTHFDEIPIKIKACHSSSCVWKWRLQNGSLLPRSEYISSQGSFCVCAQPVWEDVTFVRRRYNVTSSLIGWAHTQNNPGVLQVSVPIIWGTRTFSTLQPWVCRCLNI